MIDIFAKSNTPSNTATATKPAGGFDIFAKKPVAPSPSSSIAPRGTPTTQNAKPPGVTTGFTMPNGHEAYKTTSGSTWEYLPDGTRVVHLAPQYGGGSYSVNPNEPSQNVTTPRNDNALGTPTQGNERDHIIPVSLGGVSDKTNGRQEPLVSGTKNTATDALETKLAADVKAGRIPLAQARLQIMTAKQNQTNPQPSTSVAGNLLEGAGGAITTAAKTGANFIGQQAKGAFDIFAKPSDTEKAIEQKTHTTDLLGKAVLRTVSPVTTAVIQGGQAIAQDITDQQQGVNGTISKTLENKLVEASKKGGDIGDWAKKELNYYQQGIDENQPTAFFGLKSKDIGTALNTGAALGILYESTSPAAKSVALNLADAVSKESKVPLTYSDMQKITSSSSNEDAIAKVGEEKFNAYKEATATNSVKQALTDGFIKLGEKEPTTLSTILKNAATNPISDIGNITKTPTGAIDANSVAAVHPDEFPQKAPETPKPTTSEAGFIAPKEIASDIKAKANEVTKLIQDTKAGTKASSDLSDNLYKLQQNAQADKLIASQVLKKLDVSPKDAEAIYHYEEDKTLPLTPTQQQIYDSYVKPLAIESQKIAEKLKPTGLLTTDTYTPRYVKGKGGVMDRLTETAKGVKNVGGSNGLLNKTAASTKHRTMKVIEDDQGNRTVVSIKKGRVTGFTNQKATDLGTLKVKSNSDLLEKDIKPIQKKLDTLQKYIDGINKVKISEPVSKAKLGNAHQALSGILEQAYGISDSSGSGMTKQLKARANIIVKEIKTLESIKPGEKLTNIPGRIKSIQKKMVELSNAMSEIEAKYHPDELNNKKFVAKGGKTYTIKEATTKEIEKHTSLTYHKNVIANRITNYLDLRNKERAVEFLDKLKESPEFNNIAKKFDAGIAPTGWRPTKLQNFAGYNFEPHVAATLDKFAGDMAAGKRNIITKINNFMRTAIFFNPLIHIPNITVHWAVNRGVTPFLNPVQYPKFISSSMRAFNAVIHQNADYVEMLRSGAPLVYGNENVKQLTDLLVQKIGNDLEDPQYSKFKQLFKNYNLYALSGKATWLVNDVMTMQAIYEEMDNGATMQSAIHEVGKHIPNYRVPATILNSEELAKALRNPNLTMFGAYHYGALRSYYEMAKDLVNPVKFKEVEPNTFEEQTTGQRTKTRLKTIDKLMMMALIGLVIYPALDKLAQKLTGNKLSKLGRAGAITFPYNTYKLATGQMQWIDYLSSIVTPAVGTREALQLATNRDLRTGQNIVTSPNPKEAVGEVATDLTKTIAPLDKATQIKSGKLSLKDFALSLFRISNPASSPATKQAQSMIYDERPVLSKEIKSLYVAGDKAKADALIKDYNDRLLIFFQQATRDSGQQMSDANIKKNASEYFLKAPSAKVLKNTTDSQNKSSIDKLLTPPKAKPF